MKSLRSHRFGSHWPNAIGAIMISPPAKISRLKSKKRRQEGGSERKENNRVHGARGWREGLHF